MPDKEYDYCKIYVDGISLEDLQSFMADMFGGRFEVRTMYLDGYSIDVRNNPSVVGEGDGGFVEWPLLVEFDADGGVSDEAAVRTVARILNGLWENGLQAVASCDFEDELPWSGGIARL
ncbi:hypothetical protein FZ103_04560 [Streptomonospora sp. PA3]|uniref:hypothetical protein n=1 Tax=Streptomonospora sp. PA3 TaxID=2607326 RepID=UPI0012DE483B|nr:hypothetical protein [Streptomonospora sp. PA3]MUL40457.1 hypothetical protein [Streptomonospora sp. PA3]